MIAGRKILVQPPYGPGGLELNYAAATARLAFYLLYFDEVVPLVFNPAVGTAVMLSTELEQEYVLRHRARYMQMGENRPQPYRRIDRSFLDEMALDGLDRLNRRQGGFALAPAPGLKGRSPEVEGVLLTLEDCLPTPHHDTPLDELLAFKKDHGQQLGTLHEAIDDLYYGFGNRPLDQILPRLRGKVEAHVEQVLEAYETRHIRSYMATLRVSLKVGPPVVGEIIGQLAAGVPLVGTVLGELISLAAEKVKLPTEGNAVPKEFAYLLSGLSEGHAKAFPGETLIGEPDIRGVVIENSMFPTFYPEAITEPSRFDGFTITGAFVS